MSTSYNANLVYGFLVPFEIIEWNELENIIDKYKSLKLVSHGNAFSSSQLDFVLGIEESIQGVSADDFPVRLPERFSEAEPFWWKTLR